MLNASFNSDNAFTLADVRKPTVNETSFGLKLAIREYGQIDVVIPVNLLNAQQTGLMNEAELGYPLSDFIVGNKSVIGSFTRYRKTPTSAVSLQFNVSEFGVPVVPTPQT